MTSIQQNLGNNLMCHPVQGLSLNIVGVGTRLPGRGITQPSLFLRWMYWAGHLGGQLGWVDYGLESSTTPIIHRDFSA